VHVIGLKVAITPAQVPDLVLVSASLTVPVATPVLSSAVYWFVDDSETRPQ
jgi:hypothetical protein